MSTNKINHSLKDFQTNKNNSFLFDAVFTLAIFGIMMIIISNPTTYTNGTIEGLRLFVFAVLPGLFPFMFLVKLLTEIGFIFQITSKLDKFSYKIFGTPGVSIYAFLMSIISGYPIGAKIIADLYQKRLITQKEAQKMSIFCTTSGPIFVIGTVGTIMFSSMTFGIVLYASHILSSTILAIVLNAFSKKQKEPHDHKIISIQKRKNLVSFCVNETINSLFIVGAYITLFFLISELLSQLHVFEFFTNLLTVILSKLNISTNYLNGVLYGIVEITRGAKVLSIFSTKTAVILTSGLISFSGISIIMQSLTFLKEAKIKARTFIIFKCVHAILSMILCYLLFIII